MDAKRTLKYAVADKYEQIFRHEDLAFEPDIFADGTLVLYVWRDEKLRIKEAFAPGHWQWFGEL